MVDPRKFSDDLENQFPKNVKELVEQEEIFLLAMAGFNGQQII